MPQGVLAPDNRPSLPNGSSTFCRRTPMSSGISQTSPGSPRASARSAEVRCDRQRRPSCAWMKAKPVRSAMGRRQSLVHLHCSRRRRIAVAQVLQGRNPRPKGARTRRMLARGIDSVPIEECFVHKEVA
jgi:hypothetical protein